MNKKKTIIIIVVTLLLMSGFYYAGFKLGQKLADKESEIQNETDNNQEENNNTETEEIIVIKNKDVEEIYNIIKNAAWYPNYLETPLNETSNEILLSMVARSINKDVTISEDMYNTIKSKDGEEYASLYQGSPYVNESADLIISKTNQIFNKNITKEELIANKASSYNCTGYIYNNNIDKFLKMTHCGGGINEFTEVIYNYEENEKEINISTAVASTKYSDEESNWVYFDKKNKIYNIIDFEITKENIDNFHHLKYTFKKDANNKYYISNIEEI